MQKIIIGNLKMNLLSAKEREGYVKLFKKTLAKEDLGQTEIVLCPPTIQLESFGRALGGKVKLGGQNCFWEDSGSYTGEISPLMLKNFGCGYVICGHSERRQYLGETNQFIKQKVKAVLKNNLAPIICVGETQEERKAGLTLQVITKQVKAVFSDLTQAKLDKIILAYEPVWSVGSDSVPNSNEIMEARLLIRKILIGMFEAKNAQKVRIVYGGSVSVKTVEETCLASGMDGALIGRESLAPREFIKICKIING